MTHSGRHGQPAHSPRILAGALLALTTLFGASEASAAADPPFRKLGELELRVAGLSATAEPASLVVPKNVASGVRVVVRAAGVELGPAEIARFLGGPFEIRAEFSGPGFAATLSLPEAGAAAPSDPLLLLIPAASLAGDYRLSGMRIVVGERVALDVAPRTVDVQVIDQVLVTSVQTRPLTLDEIRARGIVLDSDAYLGFEFTLGMALESSPVSFTFPVVFDAQGVPVPQALMPPTLPERAGAARPALPTIVPMLLEAQGPPGPGGARPRLPLSTPSGAPIRIPSLLVIPGDVGYLKQFFSAQLIVANGVPAGSGLRVTDVSGTIRLPPGDDREEGTTDDPLSLPDTREGPQGERRPVVDPGPDGETGTGDDRAVLDPGEQGRAEFLIRGEREGFHPIAFEIAATLGGLPTGPVTVSGRAAGGVLVRNPYFDVTFAAPATVRKGETFKLFATVTNVGQGLGNDVGVRLDASRLSGARLVGPARLVVDTLRPGDAATLAFELRSERTGQVVASYLHFDTQDGSTGELEFALGVGERGVALSPDTLVLPGAVDRLPPAVVDAGLRVLGQAWSLARAPVGTLPAGVLRASKAAVSEKVLALAEAGLRVDLGASPADAVRDLLLDVHGSAPVDAGFDQLLRETEAGRDFARVLGAALEDAARGSGGAVGFERESSELAAASFRLMAIGVEAGALVSLTLSDGAGRRSATDGPIGIPASTIVPLSSDDTSFLALVAEVSGTYIVDVAAAGGASALSVTLPATDGGFARFSLPGLPSGSRLWIDASRPERLQLRRGASGETVEVVRTERVASGGPRLLSASVIGPEVLAGAGPFGQHLALLFDRAVAPAAAADVTRYTIQDNAVRVARRQLSGRLVLGLLEKPEGPYVPAELTVAGMADIRGGVGDSRSLALTSRLADPGAVVSGRVLNGDGTPVTSGRVTYTANVDPECLAVQAQGVAATAISSRGAYEFHYVRRDACGQPFGVSTQDPATGALRRMSSYVGSAGETIVLDLVLLGRGSVAGTVRDLLGAPVSHADVVALSASDSQSGGATRTDPAGNYRIDGITVGPVTVSASKGLFAGYATGRLDRAGGVAAIDLTLNSGSVRVSGVVRTLDAGEAAPVVGAQVLWYDGGTLLALATTDGDGRYAFEGMPAGPFTLRTGINTRDRASLSGVAAAGDVLTDRDLLIVIPPEVEFGSLSGVVSTATGAPEPGAIVSVGERATIAGADGSYVLPGIEVRTGVTQTLFARARDGLRSGQAAFVMNAAGTLARNVTLSGLGAAEFTVLGKDGTALAGVDVALLGACADACGCRFQKTGPDGRVRFEGLPLGIATAQALRLGTTLDAARGSASIASDGGVGTGILRFAGLGIVSGRVLDPDGAPAFGAEVALQSQRFTNDGVYCGLAPGVSRRVRTDVEGRFRVPRVNVGPVGVTVQQAFFPTPVGAQGHLLADGDELALTIRLVNTTAGELSGRVRLPEGAPAGSGVEVTVAGVLPDATVRTDSGGAYRFARILPAGSYTLTARDPVTGGVVQQRVFLRASQDAVQDLRLKGRGEVRVRVVDALDRPVANAYVRLAEAEFPLRVYEEAVSASSDGVARFPGVFEGAFSVEAFDAQGRGGRTSSVVTGPGSAQDVKVRLSASGTLRGHFFKRDGATPIPYGLVTLRQSGRVLGQVATLGSGDVGGFGFDFVAAGPFELTAVDPLSGRTAALNGSIESESQALEIRLVAQGLGTVRGAVFLNGAPKAAVRVTVASGPLHVATLSDGEGRYVVDGVPEGRVVVTADLGGGFLGGMASGILAGDGESLALDVALHGSGSITGRVLRADGVTPGPPSSVRLDGTATQFATSGPDGAFRFDVVPSGRVSLAVDDLSSPDYGRGVADVVEGQTTSADVRLNGLAAAGVQVLDAHGQPVPGAGVVLRVQSVPYGDLSMTRGTADAAGLAFFPEVLAGRLAAEARDPASGLTGSVNGPTVSDGGSTSFELRLQPAGRLAGTVLNVDGSLHPGARIAATLQGATRVVHADAAGAFVLEHVGVGTFVLDVDTLEGDRGRVSGNVAADATTTVAVRLTGLGSVSVRVRTPDGSAAAGVRVAATSGTGRHGETDASGVVTLGNLLAGVVTIEAFDPVRMSGARTTATLAPGAAIEVGLVLLPAGRVAGHVLEPDETTPVAGAVVSSGALSDVSDDAGGFDLTNLPVDADQVVRVSLQGRPRAVARFRLSADAPELTNLELVLVGVGSVAGTVIDAAGGVAPNQRVRLEHPAPYLGGAFVATTDATGRYRFDAIPIGSFRVSADDGLGNRREAEARLDRHGQAAVVDLALLASAVTVPVDLDDANGFRFRIGADGTVAGHEGFFGSGAPRLTVSRDGTTLPFSGSGTMAASALDRREVRLREDVAGLRLERRVYVPIEGYFVRYLDVVTNLGTEAATLDIGETVELVAQQGGVVAPVAVSAGVGVLDDADGDWYERDPFAPHRPPLGIAAGRGGSILPRLETEPQRVLYSYGALHLAPGARAAVLHFLSLQGDRGRALASVERLQGLPPEALTGLSPDDAAAIVNFAIPESVASTLDPLPPNDGFVAGRVLAADAATTLPGAAVFLKSGSAYFGRPLAATMLVDGAFEIRDADADAGGRRVLPRTTFTLSASVAQSGTQTASATGEFARTGLLDLTSLAGRVVRASSAATPALRAVDRNPATAFRWSAGDVATPGAGTPFFEIGFPRDATVARVRLAGATFLRARLEVRDAAGEVLWWQERNLTGSLDLAVPGIAGARAVRLVDVADAGPGAQFGEIEVLGDGGGAATGRSERDVVFRGTGLIEARLVRSDLSTYADGRVDATPFLTGDRRAAPMHRYLAVPPGRYTLAGTLPGDSGASVTRSVDVLPDQVTPVVLALPALGTLQGRMAKADGSPAVASLTAIGPAGERTIPVNGTFTMTDLAVGAYELRAFREPLTLSRALTLVENETSVVDFTFPPFGRLTVSVTSGGQPLPDATVSWGEGPGGGALGVCITAASGVCTLDRVAGASLVVRARHPRSPYVASETSAAISAEGQELAVALDLPVLASVAGVVTRADGSPAGAALVRVRLAGDATLVASQAAAVDGSFLLANLPPVPLLVQASRPTHSALSPTERPVNAEPGQGIVLDVELAGAVRAPGDVAVVRTSVTSGSAPSARAIGVPDGALGALPSPQVALVEELSGAFLFAVRAPGEETGAFQMDVAQGRGVRQPEGRVTGTVIFRPGTEAAAQQRVRVTRGPYVRHVLTDAAGGFASSGVPAGTAAIEVLDTAGVVLGAAQADVPEPGTAFVQIAISPRTVVAVSVTRGGAPVAAQGVSLESDAAEAPEADRRRSGTTGPDGILEVSLPAGAVRVSLVDPVTGLGFEQGGVAVAGERLALQFALPQIGASLRGHVTLMGGAPASGAEVVLSGYAPVRADDAGAYAFDDVPPGFTTVTASLGGAVRSQDVTLLPGETRIVDLGLPGAAFQGRVLEPTLEPVAGATVRACGPADSFSAQSCVTATTSGDGRYVLAGLPAWRFCSTSPACNDVTVVLTALVNDGSGLVVSASRPFNAMPPSVRSVDFVLPGTGTVAGTVRDPAGGAAAGAEVSLPDGRRQDADETGRFRFSHVRPGLVRVHAESASDRMPGRSEWGTVEDAEELTLDVEITAHGTVEGALVSEEGAPLQRPIRVVALEAPTPTGRWSRLVESAPDGSFSLRVPTGPYRAVFDGDYVEAICRTEAPSAIEGVLGVGETQVHRLARGSHDVAGILRGPLGAYGEEDNCSGHESAAPALRTDAGGVGYDVVVAREAEGRAQRSLRESVAGLEIRKQEYVPPSGAFVRTLTVVRNTTSQAIDVPVSSFVELVRPPVEGCPGGPAWILVETSSGDALLDPADSYALARPSGPGLAMGVVVGGSQLPTAAAFSQGEQDYPGDGCAPGTPGRFQFDREWRLPPDASRALLTFAVSRPIEDPDLSAQLRSLASLEDPQALIGLTEDDRRAIVNFALPGQAQVSGHVRTSTEAPAAGVRVVLMQDGTIVGETVSAVDGAFSFQGLEAGEWVVVAIDADHHPGRTAFEAVSGQAVAVVVRLPGSDGLSAVHVHATGAPDIEGVAGTLSVAGYSPAWRARAVFGPDAVASFEDVPTGAVRVELDAPFVNAFVEGAHAPPSPTTLALVLRSAGLVEGLVLDGGTPVAGAAVGIHAVALGFVAFGETGSDGRFSLAVDPPGAYRVEVYDPASGRPGSAPVTVLAARSTGVTILLAADGELATIQAAGISRATGEPTPDLPIALSAPGSLWIAAGILDGQGRATFAHVPPARVTVTVGSAGPDADSGVAVVETEGGESLDVPIEVGRRRPFAVDLTGADLQPYFARAHSVVEGSGLDDEWRCRPYCTGWSEFSVGDSERAFTYSVWPSADIGQAGREAGIGPEWFEGLHLSRRAFVPPSGRFVRVLDVLQNTRPVPVVIGYYLEQAHDSSAGAWHVVGSSSEDATFDATDTFAVVHDDEPQSPALAWVARGEDAENATTESAGVTSAESWTWLATRGRLTLPANGMAVLLRFAVQRPNGDTAAADDAARALADLSDPEALSGMSDAEVSALANFRAPASAAPRPR